MIRALLLALVVPLVAACTIGGSPTVSTSAPIATSVSSTPPPQPPLQRWSGTIRSSSEHRLYVGGACSTDWVTEIAFTLDPDGAAKGRGRARLTSHGDPCPFAVAQRQVRTFVLEVRGNFEAEGRLALRLLETGHRPSAGADDLGGFRTTTLETILRLDVRHDAVADRFVLTAPDQDRGEFSSRNVARLRCRNC